MSKKTLKEVFEFFPTAKWVTQDGRNSDSRTVNIYFSENQPFPDDNHQDWLQEVDKSLQGDERDIINVMPNDLQIHWGNRKTWDKRCVSRYEIIQPGDQNNVK